MNGCAKVQCECQNKCQCGVNGRSTGCGVSKFVCAQDGDKVMSDCQCQPMVSKWSWVWKLLSWIIVAFIIIVMFLAIGGLKQASKK